MTTDWKRIIAGMLPAVLASLALAFSFNANFRCESIQFPADVTSVETGDVYDATLRFGPWYQQTVQVSEVNDAIFVNRVCVEYTIDPQPDAKWKTVKAFSVLAPLLGGLVTMVLWFSPFAPSRFNDSKWRSLAIFLSVIITLFQGLTLLLLQSTAACFNNLIVQSVEESVGQSGGIYGESCQWDEGSSSNVASICLWFVTGVVMMVLGRPKATPRPPTETQAVTYEQTIDPETGARTVAQVNVIKGTAVAPPAAKQETATSE